MKHPENYRLILTLLISLTLPLAPKLLAAEPAIHFEEMVFETFDGQSVEAEHGRFSVPENRSKEQSRQIELSFVRFRSTAEHPGAPIVYLAGGPGGSGVMTARYTRFPMFMALRQVADVIAFDQRGTGDPLRQELRCTETFELPFDRPLDRAQGGRAMAETARACSKRLAAEGVDVTAYNTQESAADLEDLRKALGVPKISLWGISYGTHLALATVANHETSIDRIVLAGLEGLGQTLKLPSDQQALLEEIAALARRHPATKHSSQDLLLSIRQLLDQLEEKPETVALVDPETSAPFAITVGASDLRLALAGMLRGPETFRFMPDLVTRMLGGDFVSLALFVSQERIGGIGSMMALAMDCASGMSKARSQQIAKEAQSTLLKDAINFPVPEICAGIPNNDLGDDFRSDPRSAIPAFLISGTLDGRTPPRNAAKILKGLTNAHHLVLEGAGHSDPLFLSSPKILEAMLTFLQHKPGKPLALPKHLEVPFPEFLAPRTAKNLSAAELGRFTGTYRFEDGAEAHVAPGGPVLFLIGASRRPQILRPDQDGNFFVEFESDRIVFKTKKDQISGLTLVQEDGTSRNAVKVMEE